jgi:DEAD/DEAH box helicase domain-containing protein
MGSLHGLEHAMIALAPLHTLCDAADLGGITFLEHPQVAGGAIFVYDAYPGGIGLSARTFELLPQLLAAVLERLESCRCDTGCPGCIHSPRCGAGNYPLDKRGSVAALRLLLQTPIPATGPAPSASLVRSPATILSVGTPRVLYFDLETRYAAAEVGGWRYIHRMGLALAVIFDSATDRYTTYHEADAAALVEHLHTGDLVVGYNVLRFDYRVLSAYTERALERLPTFDMLVELRGVLRRRLPLANLGQATLGRDKTADGLQSLQWVRDGQLEKVEEYCRADVELTRDVFLHGVTQGWLAFERDGVQLRTPDLGWELQTVVQNAALRRAARVRGVEQPSLFAAPPRPSW